MSPTDGLGDNLEAGASDAFRVTTLSPAPHRRVTVTSRADRIRKARTEAGLTQDDLASRAGVTAKTVYRLERGERVRPANNHAIHEALGLPYIPADIPAEDSGPRLVGTPALCADADTQRMRIALADEPDVAVLARVDSEAWRAALRQASLRQQSRMGCNIGKLRPLFIIAGLSTLTAIAAIACCAYAFAVSPKVDLIFYGGGTSLVTVECFLMWFIAWCSIEDGVRDEPFGVAVTPAAILLLTNTADVVQIRRIPLIETQVHTYAHGGFVSYRLERQESAFESLTELLPGLPYDAELHRMLSAGHREDRVRSVQVTLHATQLA